MTRGTRLAFAWLLLLIGSVSVAYPKAMLIVLGYFAFIGAFAATVISFAVVGEYLFCGKEKG
jgi:hypothetical protein